jgi:putative tryptophan/tyrosine transport system substrate-binding protein
VLPSPSAPWLPGEWRGRSTAAITITFALSILATAPLADAQLPGKRIPQIGYLQGTSPSVDPHRYEAFLQGLRALGWVEGQNMVSDYRYAHGKDDLPLTSQPSWSVSRWM